MISFLFLSPFPWGDEGGGKERGYEMIWLVKEEPICDFRTLITVLMNLRTSRSISSSFRKVRSKKAEPLITAERFSKRKVLTFCFISARARTIAVMFLRDFLMARPSIGRKNQHREKVSREERLIKEMKRGRKTLRRERPSWERLNDGSGKVVKYFFHCCERTRLWIFVVNRSKETMGETRKEVFLHIQIKRGDGRFIAGKKLGQRIWGSEIECWAYRFDQVQGGL